MALDPATFTAEELARLREALEERLVQLLKELRALLDAAPKDEEGRIVGGRKAAIVQQVIDRLVGDYEDLFGVVLTGYRDVSAGLLESVSEALAEQGITDSVTTTSEAQLRSIATGAQEALAEVRGERVKALRDAVRQTFGTTTHPDVALEKLRQHLGGTLSQAMTLVDTHTMALDRTLVVEQSQESGFEWFVYGGPDDALARPWCAARVGFLFHATELDEEQNDTGPQPPSAFGGGYHCRHRWDAVEASRIREFPRWRNRSYDSPQRRLAA